MDCVVQQYASGHWHTVFTGPYRRCEQLAENAGAGTRVLDPEQATAEHSGLVWYHRPSDGGES